MGSKRHFTSQVRRVVIAANMASCPGREWLSGILRYMAERRTNWSWRLLRSERELSAESLARLSKDGLDGFILANPLVDDAATRLSRSRFPLVIVGKQIVPDPIAKRRNVAMISADNGYIGKLAAGHFLHVGGFASFGFIGTKTRRAWSSLRLEGYSGELKRHGISCVAYSRCDDGIGRRYLSEFLALLPKPAAVFAAWDYRALDVTGVCRECGISIPGQISLIGVDNDPVVCESAGMSLTSIDQGGEEIGYKAAEILDRMMSRGRITGTRCFCCGSPRVVPRHSTNPIRTRRCLCRTRSPSSAERHAAAFRQSQLRTGWAFRGGFST